MGRVTKFMEKTNMKSVFCAGAGIQSILFFLNGGYLPAGRELSPRTRIGNIFSKYPHHEVWY